MSYIALTYWDLAFVSLLVLINAGISLYLQLGVAKKLLIAAVRTAIQLTLMGFVLKALFALTSPLWTALAAIFMILFAGREIMARQERRFKGWWSYGLGTISMTMASFIVTIVALTAIAPDPWYAPRFALPMLGIIIGNTMTGISLGLHNLLEGVTRERAAVEAQLCLGRTIWVATRPVIRKALHSAFMPIINSMSAAGLVLIPGMMTGQILAGADPIEAVKYQILVMFVIAGGTALGAVSAVFGGISRLTDARHRLRLDRLAEKS
ncbi:MAG: iron export ABC transporter permease subunit FetB [Rhodospirillales bacterium]|nr:iron export ABC transporter permease subunit FetB [Rhodospirillales bacterium]